MCDGQRENQHQNDNYLTIKYDVMQLFVVGSNMSIDVLLKVETFNRRKTTNAKGQLFLFFIVLSFNWTCKFQQFHFIILNYFKLFICHFHVLMSSPSIPLLMAVLSLLFLHPASAVFRLVKFREIIADLME